MPELTPTEIDELLKAIEQRRLSDPLALGVPDETSAGQYTVSRSGANLEMALYICGLTGAFPYTNIRRRWSELLTTAADFPESAKVWSPLSKAFRDLDFSFLNNVDSRFACEMRKDGRLESFRSFLRRVWTTVGGSTDPNRMDALARDFADELKDEYRSAQTEWAEIDRCLLKWAGTSIAGAVVTGGLDLGLPALGFSVAAVTELISARYKRRAFRKTVPLSVFMDLASKT
jgi:hypothetical protein